MIGLEFRRDGVSHEFAIMNSCDLLYSPAAIVELVRKAVRERLRDLDRGYHQLTLEEARRRAPEHICTLPPQLVDSNYFW